MTSSRLLSTGEVAARLGIARQTVIYRVGSGALTPVQQLEGRNGAYLFDAEQIDAMVESEQIAPGVGRPRTEDDPTDVFGMNRQARNHREARR